MSDTFDKLYGGGSPTEVNEQNQKITGVRESIIAVCPANNPEKKKEPWEDEELHQLIKELRKCSKHEDLRCVQKAIKNSRVMLKNIYYKELADNINTAAEARDVQKEFALAKKYCALKTSNKNTRRN